MKSLFTLSLFVLATLLNGTVAQAGTRVPLNNGQRVVPLYEMRLWGGITTADVLVEEIRNVFGGAVKEYRLTVLKKPVNCAQLGQGCGVALAFYTPTKVNDECTLRARVISGGRWKMESVETLSDASRTYLAGKELRNQVAHTQLVDYSESVWMTNPGTALVGVLVNPYEVGKTYRIGGTGAVCNW
ncbi:MAG: hypothetical protein KBD24_02855 [Candidatus Pacebacteria bacterium]|nr:hypothetical protein [Candidatus Paceibacterota bacterium]